jgi:hypothetical protein
LFREFPLARLSALTIFELRGEWRRLHRMPPPMRLSRDLLIRGTNYELQERAYTVASFDPAMNCLIDPIAASVRTGGARSFGL